MLDTIRQEIRDFIHNDIEVAPGYDFNQYETIKRIHLYSNNRFYEATEYLGRPLIFYQISQPRKDAVVRFLNVDTKDFRLYEIAPDSEFAVMLLQKEMEKHFSDTNFAATLNELADTLATFGSVVLEKTKEGPKIVDLRRLFLDPTVDDIQKSRFVTIKYFMTEDELRGMVKQGWDKDAIERVIRSHRNANKKTTAPDSYQDDASKNEIVSSRYIEVYKRFGLAPKSEIVGGNSEDEVRSLYICAEPFGTYVNQDGNKASYSECLYKGEWAKDYPFVDFHLQKTLGRWLGIGVFEALFPAQERFNELMNQRRISMEISSMQWFQTADPTVLNNVLTDLENGAVIRTKVQGSLAKIDNTERNLSTHQLEEVSYSTLADSVTHASDLMRGAEVPTSTPATNAVITNNNQSSIQMFKRQNFANFLREYVREFLIPDLVKNIREEHVLRFVGDAEELSRLDEQITDVATLKEIKKRALSMEVLNDMIIEDIRDSVRQDLKKLGNKRFPKVLEGYYQDVMNEGYGIDVNIDSEQENIATIANNTFQFLTLIASNPALLDDPVNKELTFSYARKIGMDTGKMEIAMAKRDSSRAQQAMPVPAQEVIPQPLHELGQG